MNETECRNIGTVKVLEEEWLSMKSVDGEVLAAGRLGAQVSGKRQARSAQRGLTL
jgi:hypothetical protein